MANRAGFLSFLRTSVGLTSAQLPDNSTDIDSALALSLEIVYSGIQQVSQLMYDQAVYNLGMSNLIEFANDQAGQTYFATARKTYNISGFVPGVISSTSDEGTSEGLLNPEVMKNLALSDLQYLKNPWGRQYLAIAQRVGSGWGMS